MKIGFLIRDLFYLFCSILLDRILNEFKSPEDSEAPVHTQVTLRIN